MEYGCNGQTESRCISACIEKIYDRREREYNGPYLNPRNHKCLKEKIFPAVQPIIAVVLDSTKGGGDSFHGKVCELTSIGIKRGSAALWARPRVPGLIHELFRYERLTRFFCLSHFSISQERNHRWGLQWICLGTIHAILSRNFYPTRLPSR